MHIIADPEERMARCMALRPGESVRVAKDPPLLWAYPPHIVIHEFPDHFYVKSKSPRELAIEEYLENLPTNWADGELT